MNMLILSCHSFQILFALGMLFMATHIEASSSSSKVEYLPGFQGPLPFELETGYIGLGESDDDDDMQVFYYFVKSENNPQKDPLMIWLSGGPGCSSFSGLVNQIGPITIEKKEYNGSIPSLVLRPQSWTKLCNIMFADLPFGTGFSYAKNTTSHRSDRKFVHHVHQFIRKWLIDHPEFLSNEFYVGGDSYAGIPIPAIVKEISNGNGKALQPLINLKGYLLGNPVTTRKEKNDRISYAHGMGLISNELYESLQQNCKGEYIDVNSKNVLCLRDLQYFDKCISGIKRSHILDYYCEDEPHVWRRSLTQGFKESLSYHLTLPVPDLRCQLYKFYLNEIWANEERVRKALHIREGTIEKWIRCYRNDFEFDITNSVEFHVNLSKKGFRSLIYSGDHDLVVPFLSTQAWIKDLNYSIVDDWRSWLIKDQVAGSVKTIPPHRYLTRAHRRRIMENYEQDQAAIREEMDQMKGKVDAILEAIQALRAERVPVAQEIPVVVNQAAASQPDVIPPSSTPFEFQARTNATLGMPFSFMTADTLGASNQGGSMPLTPGVPTTNGPVFPFPTPPSQTEIPIPAFCGTQFANPEMQTIPTAERARPVEKSAEKYKILEERIRAIEGFSAYGMDAEDMCLVPNLVVPPKFKTPDFQKYKGLSCPKSHIIMYCRKMASHIHNEPLLIHCFQDSLSGASLNWYMNLERNRIRSWKDLYDAFLKQYQYNIDMAPTRLQLQNQVQRTNETFKEYAQRWREMAAQVNPPLSESELVDMFMNTLQGHYYERMVGSVSSGFSDLVRIGERIENGLKIGKIQNPANTTAANQYGYKKPQGNFVKKKEGETSATYAQDQAPRYQVAATAPQAYVAPVGQQPWVPYQQYVQQQGYQQRQGQQRQNRPKRVYDRVPMSYSQLLAALLDQKLIQLAEARPPPDPLPPNYKINAKCEFHSGGSGHTTEECRVLKDRVQDLIDAKEITFAPVAPNVVNNPMPPHNGASTSGT